MRAGLFVLGLLLSPSTGMAASFSLIPTSSLFIGQGQFASFDVLYTAEEGDNPALAANLRIFFEHARRPPDVITGAGNNNENPFDIPTLFLGTLVCNLCPQLNAVDIGGSQQDNLAVNATSGIKLGEISFGVEGPFMGNAGVITLTRGSPQTGSRDANFDPISDNTPKVLAVIYVPEASLSLLVFLGFLGLAWRAGR